MSNTTMAANINPIRLELLKNALASMCDNMLGLVVRTARSTNIKNTMDFAATVCDPRGQLVAQGVALPAQLGAMMPALKGCLDWVGNDLHEGDIIASNDPYAGASHLNDVFMFKPVFVAGECVAILGLILHHTDLGGRAAGGNATDSSEIFQEGLRIPPCKIYEKGKPNVALFRVIEHNTRVPNRVMGDIRAQIATLDGGEIELRTIVSEFGVADYKAYTEELMNYTERLARANIAALPDGVVEFTDWNDDDGAGGGPVKLHVTLTKKGETFTLDFTGTAPQGKGALQPNLHFTTSCACAALRTVIDPDIPNNAGFFRVVKIIAPEGCFLNPRYPAATGARGQVGFRIRSLVFGALAQLLPDRIPACTGGSEFGLVVAGLEAKTRKNFLHLEYHNTTGQGGGPLSDGQDAGPYCIGNLANVPVEIVEAESPLRIEEYAFLPDTGGAGKFRGGLGIVRQYKLLADEATLQLRSDRHLHPCWGLHGGQPGAVAKTYLNPGAANEVKLPSKFVRTIKQGDVFRAEMPGSGGYGDPRTRDPEAVRRDVMQGKVTPAQAKVAYGVVIDGKTCAIDAAATQRERASGKA
jgi:N-methylhydantoinase B